MSSPSGVQKLPSHWWWDLSTRDFATLDMSGIVAVLPVGAVEQHGPHLPVSVDSAINTAIIARAVSMMDDSNPVLVLPPSFIGKSTEHIEFPGTLTLSHDTLTQMWIEIGASVFRAGVRRMLIFNAHGGQPQIVEIVCRELRARHGMMAVGTMWSRITRQDDLFDAEERTHGIHGGEIETSVMLAAYPDLVSMKFADNFIPLSVELERAGGLLTPEGAVAFGWLTQDLNPEGACGNAAAADARRGDILIDRAARALLKLCGEIAAFPMEKLSIPPLYPCP